ncbi:hypothetical protein [Terrisporobacter petrolearius]|uniref:hypothetical protein n=1 Tax=Terrisporobacter petrolearius TaxID=1460447 RepID=UPI003B00E0B8
MLKIFICIAIISTLKVIDDKGRESKSKKYMWMVEMEILLFYMIINKLEQVIVLKHS